MLRVAAAAAAIKHCSTAAAAAAAAAAAPCGCLSVAPTAATAGGVWTAVRHVCMSDSAMKKQQQQQQYGEKDESPGQAFLASLKDYEKQGVPKAAGVSAAAATTAGSNAADSPSSSSSSSQPVFDLGTMRALLAALGNPQQQLSVVHIAGTKGKGSVAALVSGVLRAAGYRVGTYTSPHMFDIRERIVVGGIGAPDMRPAAAATAATASAAAAGGSGGDSQPAATAAAAAAVPAAVPVSAEQFEALAVQAAAAVAQMQAESQQQEQGQQGTAVGAVTSRSSSSSDAGAAAAVANCSSSSKRPSHFEVVTAMALQHFVNEGADIAVIETGLGGATDATNVFAAPQLQLSVLTAVGMDHVEALGGSLESIAAAKAGIMKPGVPVVVGPQEVPAGSSGSNGSSGSSGSGGSGSGSSGSSAEVVLRVFKDTAAGLGCPLVQAEQVVQVTPVEQQAGNSIVLVPGPGEHLARQVLSVTSDTQQLTAAALAAAANTQGSDAAPEAAAAPQETQRQPAELMNMNPSSPKLLQLPQQTLDFAALQLLLVGAHQACNVQTAVAAVLLLAGKGWRGITAEAISSGLQAAWLPGRCQVLQLPGSATYYVLDGAHTADSAAALAATLRAAFPTQPVVLVVAMAADKQHRDTLQALRALRPKVAVFTSVAIAGSHARSAPPGTLAAHWQAAGMLSTDKPFRCREMIQAGLGAALDKARHELGAYGGKGVVVVTGSLHAVAAALKQLAVP